MERVIEVERLAKKFGTFTADDYISFYVERGEIFGFLGANGAGKTTAMRMLCGLSKPTFGTGNVVGLRRHQRLFVGRHRRIEGAGRCKLSADIDLVRQECRLAVSVRKRCIYPGGRFLGLCNNQHRGRSAGNGIQ